MGLGMKYEYVFIIISLQIILSRQTFIFPGTKWCGQGNISRHENDFGIFKNVDLCCKVHDECDKLLPGESKDGLTNNTPFSKLACYCDDDLYYCLKRTGFPLGTLIKTIYVAGQTQCYKMEYPIVRCRQYKIRLDCSCDENFKECLKQEKCKIGKTVGCLYFLGQEKCYKNEYPIVKCHRYDNKVFKKRCVEYQLDKTKEKEYQFFDLPFFKSKS